jgi:23S rRNA (uracil1939-C5)-methyltransferase
MTMFRKGDPVTVTILDTAEDDACMGRLPEGMVVFVRGQVTPGDVVAANISKIKKNYLEAKLDRVITASPDRVDPVCAHYGVCGGCKWQHVAYGRQCDFKRKLVQDTLQRVGGFAGFEVEPVRAAAEADHYRNKVDFTFSNERFILEEELDVAPEQRAKSSDFALGFHRPRCFNKIIDIDRCHIATDLSSGVLEQTRRFFLVHPRPAYSTFTHEGFLRNLVVRHAGITGQCMVNLITSWHEPELMRAYADHLLQAFPGQLTTILNSTTERKNLVAYGEVSHVLHGDGRIIEELDGLVFVISPNSFFQTNSRQALALYRTVAEMAQLRPDDVLYDLYCGTGSITLFAGRACRLAYGFELEPSAVADAVVNAERNSMADRCTFVATDMKHLHTAMNSTGHRPDVVITDPPRAGMHEDAVATLLQLAPRRIIYVSCHPASLARDAKALCAGGEYRLVAVQPVDLFPQTFHIESVACLERIAGA